MFTFPDPRLLARNTPHIYHYVYIKICYCHQQSAADPCIVISVSGSPIPFFFFETVTFSHLVAQVMLDRLKPNCAAQQHFPVLLYTCFDMSLTSTSITHPSDLLQHPAECAGPPPPNQPALPHAHANLLCTRGRRGRDQLTHKQHEHARPQWHAGRGRSVKAPAIGTSAMMHGRLHQSSPSLPWRLISRVAGIPNK